MAHQVILREEITTYAMSMSLNASTRRLPPESAPAGVRKALSIFPEVPKTVHRFFYPQFEWRQWAN